MKKALALIMSAVMILGTAVMASAESGNSMFVTVVSNDSGVLDSGLKGNWTVSTKDSGVIDSGKVESDNNIFPISSHEFKIDEKIEVKLTTPANYTGNAVVSKADITSGTITVRIAKEGGSGGNGGGGGGGNGGGSLVGNYNGSTINTNKGAVSSATASKAATASVAAAVKSAIASGVNTANATVSLSNAGKITPAVFKSIVAAAEKAAKGLNVNVTINADTVVGKVVTARMYMDLDAAAGLTTTVDTSIDTNAASKLNASIAKKFGQYFKNDIAVVSFGQKGAFGMEIKAAVKVDTSKLDTAKLKFFNYNTSTNAYTEMANTGYFVDTNGYVHFATNTGNSVVIADAPLTSK